MKIPKGHGFDLTGGVVFGVVVSPGSYLQGTLLGVVGDRTGNWDGPKGDCCCDDDNEFLLLQLTCDLYPYFSIGSVIAVNINNIFLIGPNDAPCLA